jgi:hypothetical protein
MRFTLHNLFELFEFFSQNRNPSKSQARDIPYSKTLPVPNPNLPPSYSPPEFNDLSKQWMLPPNEPLPPPYEAAVISTLREQSPAPRDFLEANAANQQASPVPQQDSSRSHSLPVNSMATRHVNEDVKRREEDITGRTANEKDKMKTEELVRRGIRNETNEGERVEAEATNEVKQDNRERKEDEETNRIQKEDEINSGNEARDKKAEIGRQREDKGDGERDRDEQADKRESIQGETDVETQETNARTSETEGADSPRYQVVKEERTRNEVAIEREGQGTEETIGRTRDGEKPKEQRLDKLEFDGVGKSGMEATDKRPREGEEEKGRAINKMLSKEEKSTTIRQPRPKAQTEIGIKKTSGQTSGDELSFPNILQGPQEENCEISRHSPSLMRATTRLAGIGFGAKAAAQALKSGRRPRSQTGPGRTLKNDRKRPLHGNSKSCVGVDGVERDEPAVENRST